MTRRLVAAALAALVLPGCAGSFGGQTQIHVYDFGIEAPDAKLAGVRVGQVRAAAPFDSTEIHYRLAYRNPAELLSFSQSRWAAVPAELYRKRIARAADGSRAGRCVLDLELHEITQVFAARDASEALLELRASLADAGGRVAERIVRVVQPGGGAGAAQGVAAMSRAADRSIEELGNWVAQQPACKGP